MKLARPDIRHPRIVLAGCPALPEGDGDDAELVAALRQRGLHARWLSWDDPETLRADLVILRATWDYIDRFDEFLDWSTRVANLLNPPAVVAWNTDKRYLADLADAGVPTVREPASSRRASGCGCRRVRWWSSLRSAPDRLVHNALPMPAPPASTPRHCTMRAAPCWSSPMTPGWRTARPRWCSSAASSRMPSPRGRCCRPPASGRCSTRPAPTPRRPLTAADPDFELWDVGHAALDAAAAHLNISSHRPPVRPRRRDRRTGRSAAAGVGVGGAVTGLASARRDHAGPSTTPVRASASSQPWTGSGSVRSRIDAHSAAVAAVHAAAPATWIATSAAGTPVKNCTVPTRA